MTPDGLKALMVAVAFILGIAVGWYESTSVTVVVVPPSVQAQGPDWLQPADEQAVEVFSVYRAW